jgi:hypothetical protein
MMTRDTLIGIIGAGISLAGLLFSVWAFVAHISKALNKLLDQRMSFLSLLQAQDLAGFYLSAVRHELMHDCMNFLNKVLPLAIKDKNTEEAKAFVYTTADKTIFNQRSKLGRFCLADRSSFDQFLVRVSPLDGGTIKSAKDEVYKVFEDAISGVITAEVASSRAITILGEAHDRASDQTRNALARLYQSSHFDQ